MGDVRTLIEEAIRSWGDEIRLHDPHDRDDPDRPLSDAGAYSACSATAVAWLQIARTVMVRVIVPAGIRDLADPFVVVHRVCIGAVFRIRLLRRELGTAGGRVDAACRDRPAIRARNRVLRHFVGSIAFGAA